MLVIAFTIGVSATAYFAWVAPCLQRRQLRKQQRKANRSSSCPSSPNGTLKTPYGSPDLEKCPSIFSKEADGADEILSPPAAVFAVSRDRFSTSSRDGVWWVV